MIEATAEQGRRSRRNYRARLRYELHYPHKQCRRMPTALPDKLKAADYSQVTLANPKIDWCRFPAISDDPRADFERLVTEAAKQIPYASNRHPRDAWLDALREYKIGRRSNVDTRQRSHFCSKEMLSLTLETRGA